MKETCYRVKMTGCTVKKKVLGGWKKGSNGWEKRNLEGEKKGFEGGKKREGEKTLFEGEKKGSPKTSVELASTSSHLHLCTSRFSPTLAD